MSERKLTEELGRSQNSYIAKMSDGHNSIIVRSKDDELAECYRLMTAAKKRIESLEGALRLHRHRVESFVDAMPFPMFAETVDEDLWAVLEES